MDHFIERQNIERLTRLIEQEMNPARLKILQSLLEKEQKKLAAHNS